MADIPSSIILLNGVWSFRLVGSRQITTVTEGSWYEQIAFLESRRDQDAQVVSEALNSPSFINPSHASALVQITFSSAQLRGLLYAVLNYSTSYEFECPLNLREENVIKFRLNDHKPATPPACRITMEVNQSVR